MELNELIENVQQWSIDRGLDKADSKKQLLKLYEEFGELASGIAKNKPDVIMDSIGDCVVVLIILAQQKNTGKYRVFGRIDVVNDIIIEISKEINVLAEKIYFNGYSIDVKISIATLITYFKKLSYRQDVNFEDCLEMAWNAIKDRKGKLINGVWVKEEDLPGGKSPEQTLDAVVEADMINNPSHYQGRNGLEAMEVVREFAPCPEYVEGFHWGNAMKYMMRYHKKNGVEDLKKARKNLDWLIEELEK